MTEIIMVVIGVLLAPIVIIGYLVALSAVLTWADRKGWLP